MRSSARPTAQRLGWLKGCRNCAPRSGPLTEPSRNTGRSNGINDVNGVTLNDQRMFDVNQRLSELRADYAGSQAKLQQISDMRSRGIAALEAVPEVLASDTIINLRDRETELLKEESELRSTYGGKHPLIVSIQEEKATLQRKIDAEVERIATTIANEGEVIASRIRALEGELKECLRREQPRSRGRRQDCMSWSATPMRPATSTTHSWSATKSWQIRAASSRPTPRWFRPRHRPVHPARLARSCSAL